MSQGSDLQPGCHLVLPFAMPNLMSNSFAMITLPTSKQVFLSSHSTLSDMIMWGIHLDERAGHRRDLYYKDFAQIYTLSPTAGHQCMMSCKKACKPAAHNNQLGSLQGQESRHAQADETLQPACQQLRRLDRLRHDNSQSRPLAWCWVRDGSR